LDVRCISKTISYLNDKLDSVTSLTEPRENAFLRYQDGAPDFRSHRHARRIKTALWSTPQPSTTDQVLLGTLHRNQTDTLGTDSRPSPITCISARSDSNFSCTDSSLIDIARCLAAFGRILVSTTYPALCTIRLPSQLVVHLTAKSTIRAVDYHGRPQCTGSADPIEVMLTDSDGRSVPVELFDMGDGTYDLLLRPVTAGLHQLSVRILSRPIRGSPFQLLVRRAQQREWCFTEGADGRGLIQPFAVAYGPYPQSESVTDSTPTNFVYLLDTGNSRLLVINPTTGCLHATLYGTPLTGQAATGIAWAPEGLWIVNWRTKQVYLLDPRTDQVIRSIHSSQFVEPTSACRCPLTGRLYVADNGAGCVFWCDPVTGTTQPFVGAGVRREVDPTPPTSPITRTPSPCLSVQENESLPLVKLPRSESRSFRRVTGICATDNGELILSTGSTVRIFSRDGAQLTTLSPPIFARENVPCGGTRITTTLPSRATSSTAAYLDRSSASSTLTLNTNCAIRPAVSPTADRHSLCTPGSAQHSAAFPTRGQFGGVVVARLSDDALEWFDSLGVCLLASYSDRQRSGVVVWPQFTWSSCTAQPLVAGSGSDVLCDRPFEDSFLPYLVETDPGLRRLAGLIALSDCRHLVVVDQGAQSLCRLRYA
ncbi:tripartite motif-containing protein 2/3, partial [Paragonimus westermani]